MQDLAATVDGIQLRNPVLIGSGPPSASFTSIDRGRRAGFGGVVIKTVSPDDQPIKNVAPRYGRIYAPGAARGAEPIGFLNIELIATESIEHWLGVVKRLKDTDPAFAVICSFMAPCNRPDDWTELVLKFETAGCDGFEINASCPHGFADRGMGAAIGENPTIVGQVCSYVSGATKKPVWLKLTPNVLPQEPARQALANGASGISAINTVRGIIDVDLDLLQPMPKVTGTKVSTTGGYSGPAVLPIALARVNDVAKVIHVEFGGKGVVSGIGGIVDWQSAVKHLLLGADTIQICTAIMLHGPEVVRPILDGITKFMDDKGFATVTAMSGHLRDSIVSFGEVQRQFDLAKAGKSVVRDSDWNPDTFTAQVDELS